MSAILVGCDPEVFVRQAGVFKSAWGLIKGDKKKPHPVRNGAVQVDGMALEFNIDAAATEAEFVYRVQDVLDQMIKMVPGYEVVATPVAHFPMEYIKSQPDEARELGCDPDYNAWTGAPNERPDGDRPMRTASGHVHIGWTNGEDIRDPNHIARANHVVKNMDFFVGLGSLVYDQEVERRSMYGKAGACRYKSYGVEYRTPSNAWLKNADRMAWVYRQVQRCMEQTMAGNLLEEKYGDIQAIINTSDLKAAMKIIKKEKMEICNA